MGSRISFTLYLSCLAATLVFAQPPTKQDDLKARVQKLTEQMYRDPDFTKRDAAEWELLKLGPDILPLLGVTNTTAARTVAVHATLSELLPRKATLKFTDATLATILDSLKKQTGMTLVDRRQSKDSKAITTDLPNATYWQIADALAAKTNSRLHLYQADGKVALIDGPDPRLPVNLHGPFRIAHKRISSHLDLDGKTHTTKLGIEIAWEPRFSPYLIEIGGMSFILGAVDKKHAFIVRDVAGRGPVVVTESNAKEFEVIFPSPPRAVAVISEVKGYFVVTMPSKSLEFIFKEKPVQGARHITDGVQVTVEEFAGGKDKWKVRLAVEVPAAGPSFASFQTWLGSKAWLDQCSCQLERTDAGAKEVLKSDPSKYTQVGEPKGNKVAVSYQFSPPQSAGKIEDWRLVYRVPGRMVEVTVPFVFDRVELP
ncbi:MAG TPA: hypothetical protein VE988_06775 [Gemmataceae bacterium]|nr:hypothetical protein [Gemmataceae bacterium]